MSPTVEKIRGEIAELSPEERLEFLRSIEDRPNESTLHAAEAAWDEAEGERVADIVSGRVELKSYDELTARLDAVRQRHGA